MARLSNLRFKRVFHILVLAFLESSMNGWISNLLGILADSHPDWHITMVGPVVKIDPALLPQRPNIHYFGQRHYSELPSFISGWDLVPPAIRSKRVDQIHQSDQNSGVYGGRTA